MSSLQRYHHGTWHAVPAEQAALLFPHMRLEQRFVWDNGTRHVGGDAQKTKTNRRVRRVTPDNEYVFYLVEAAPWRRIFG